MITVKSAGDAALLLETSELVHPGHQGGNDPARIAAAIRAADVPGLADVVPGASTVLVTFRPAEELSGGPPAGPVAAGLAQPGRDLAVQLLRLANEASAVPPGLAADPVVIDTVYDGPDLADVAALTGLTVDDVIARHQAVEYRVGWLGFSPGFGYLTGLDQRLAVPRLDSPRQSVPAGSVAIASDLTAVYPAASPGGWRLLGRTAAVLWDPDRDPPALFTPGQRVRFRTVSQFRRPHRPHFTVPERPNQDESLAKTYASREMSPGRWVEVLRPGPLTTVQDLGRPGLAHLGVPASGAADKGSLRLANGLVGNGEGDACLEVTLGRLELRFGFDAIVAVTGAPAPVSLSQAAVAEPGGPGPARHREVASGRDQTGGPGPAGNAESGGPAGTALPAPAHATAFSVPAGTVLRLGAPGTGLRSYLAISGGIDATPVLGSRSADLLSGLGPAPLRSGQVLPAGSPRSRPENEQAPRPRAAELGASMPPPGAAGQPAAVLRVVRGPRDDWFTAEALSALAGESYQVTAASNRSGLRLAGPRLARARRDELPSEGMAAGSLQVSHDGQPILLLADRPTTGGYPVIGVVVSADLDVAAQLRPGQPVRFRFVGSQAATP